MLSIKFKIILAYTIVFGIMLIVFAFIIYNNIKETNFFRLNTNLKNYAISLQTEIEDEIDDNSSLDLKTLTSIRGKGLVGERFQLFDDKGNIIIKDSLLSKIAISNINTVVDKKNEIERKKIAHQKYHILWSKFETENDSIYVLETASSVKDVYDDLDRLFYLFLIIIPAGLIITGISAYFISKEAFKPIAKMSNTAKKISIKNLDKRLELPKAKDEVRALGETLNEMIERIDDAFNNQKRFIANASHEIRTPLTVIQTELEILEKKLIDPESKESIKIALTEIDDLTNLTNSLLTIAKLDSSEMKLNLNRFRIDELLIECIQSMNQFAKKKNIQINLLLSEAIEIEADKEKLKSVFANLLDNSIKYSNENSSISVEIEKVFDSKVNITVKDSGFGISKDDVPYIFNRFYRSNEIRSDINGSGLGLAIAKEIVELHKGEIKVETKVEEGTIFVVSLPVINV